MDENALALRKSFIGWQCLLRRLSMRRAQGRPSRGLVPSLLADDDRFLGRAIVLLTPLEPDPLVSEFRFLYQRTQDPQRRREDMVRVMAAGFFQQPSEFSDRMTAMFADASSMLPSLLKAGELSLHFEQHDVAYRLRCRASRLSGRHPLHQLTYWHNLNFNPHVPPNAAVVAFTPDWQNSRALTAAC